MKKLMQIELKPYTRERCHEMYKTYQPDPMMTNDEFTYQVESIDKYFDLKVMDKTRVFFAIVYDDKTIGEIQLKYIDFVNRTGTLSIIIANDEYKNSGAGTEAIQKMLSYAKKELNFKSVFADAIHRNSRSQYVLERIGFKHLREDEKLKYYEYKIEE